MEKRIIQSAIHITSNTTSIPFPSAPSYLCVHMPSRALFQYAPDALCMPRFSGTLFSTSDSVAGGGGGGDDDCAGDDDNGFWSDEASASAVVLVPVLTPPPPLPVVLTFERTSGCWMMVLLTANLYLGVPVLVLVELLLLLSVEVDDEDEDSETRALRKEFY